jgi:hypothetical protein
VSILGSHFTVSQRSLIWRLSTGALYVRGNDVQVARRLERMGFLVLTDDGTVGSTNWDGERWSARLTKAGEEIAPACAPTGAGP